MQFDLAQITRQFLMQFLPQLPVLLVYLVGTAIALTRIRSCRKAAILTAISLIGLLVLRLLSQVAWIVIPRLDLGGVHIRWVFQFVNFGTNSLQALCWIGLLVAVFSGRRTSPFAKA